MPTITARRLSVVSLVLSGAALASITVAAAQPGGNSMKADTDGDGQISRAEAISAATDRFETADANADGLVTKEEMRAAAESRREGRESRRKGRRGPKEGRLFDEADFNEDGQLSLAEMEQHAEDRFSEMDADGDGLVTKDEAKAHMKAKRDAARAARQQ